ncbi:MAG: hypothetical protein HKN51_00160 [Saprospiraceae bacterium]|nr:hypothetical protein [Saprospiraceae bacterium]
MREIFKEETEFKDVILNLKESQRYFNDYYKPEIDKTIQILQQNSPSEMVANNGINHFSICKSLDEFSTRKSYYKILQNKANYENILKSKLLRKIARIVNKEHLLWGIGHPFSYQKENFIIYQGEIKPDEIIAKFNFQNNLIPHIWRDIKVYREKGVIDIETGEGIIGTVILDDQENVLIKKNWEYSLIDKDGKRIFKVLCGSIGLYEIKIDLTMKEINRLNLEGLAFLDSLYHDINRNPTKYNERIINNAL